MRINFKYNNQDYNFPDDKKHIEIQSAIRKRIETLLEPLNDQLKKEPTGNIDVNYNEENPDEPSIQISGFSIDSTPKIITLLNTM